MNSRAGVLLGRCAQLRSCFCGLASIRWGGDHCWQAPAGFPAGCHNKLGLNAGWEVALKFAAAMFDETEQLRHTPPPSRGPAFGVRWRQAGECLHLVQLLQPLDRALLRTDHSCTIGSYLYWSAQPCNRALSRPSAKPPASCRRGTAGLASSPPPQAIKGPSPQLPGARVWCGPEVSSAALPLSPGRACAPACCHQARAVQGSEPPAAAGTAATARPPSALCPPAAWPAARCRWTPPRRRSFCRSACVRLLCAGWRHCAHLPATAVDCGPTSACQLCSLWAAARAAAAPPLPLWLLPSPSRRSPRPSRQQPQRFQQSRWRQGGAPGG